MLFSNNCGVNVSQPMQLDPDVKGTIIGVQAQMATFDVLFGMQLAMHEDP